MQVKKHMPDVPNCAFILGLSAQTQTPPVGNISTLADLFCSRSAVLQFVEASTTRGTTALVFV
jgi:hypothetical protein